MIATVVSDPMDSVIDYECPNCGRVYSLEPDAGDIVCECKEMLTCDVMSSLMANKIEVGELKN